MKHFATPSFWSAYRALSDEVRSVADKNFALLNANPRHPSLRLKKVGAFWSVRVGRGHRAVARHRAEGFVWFWIGPHDQYDRLIG
ncbi:hypothetical protein [Rubrivirga sp. S365]|uniref:type II toxin-antitoxin system RelE family toxin n=1 Tax=Rubrivirga sp. S365 TaxID=3076080 RepID=UPI0028D3236C|nr:hypothetical protein [Rubrivirga sp. S365]